MDVEVQVVQELPVQKAAAEMQPAFSRTRWSLAPDWRWQAASEIRQWEKQGLTHIGYKDPGVLLARRLQDMMSDKTSKAWTKEKWPYAYEVYNLGIDPRSNAMRIMIEAAILRGYPECRANEEMKWLKPGQYELYKTLFFDMSGITACNEWIDVYVFRPLQSDKRRLRELINLSQAYNTVDDLSDILDIFGRKSSSKFYSDVLANERMKKIVEYAVSDTPMPMELYVQFMETAVKAHEDHVKKIEEVESKETVQLPQDYIKGIQKATEGFVQAAAEAEGRKAQGIDPLYGIDYIRDSWKPVLAAIQKKESVD